MRFSFSNQGFFDAIRKGDIRRVKKLGQKSPQLINQYEKSTKMLPIQLAAYEGQLDIVKLLINVGANPTQGNRPNRMQTHALYYAEKQGHNDVADYIWSWLSKHRKHTREAQRLCEAIKANDIKVVDELLNKDNTLANATEFGEASGFPGGDPVLHYAILNDSPGSVKRLIAHGADLMSRCVRDRFPIQTALSFLVGFGPRPGLDKDPEPEKRLKIVEILLNAGVKRDVWVECCLGTLSEAKAIVEADPAAVNRSTNPSEASGGLGMDHYPLSGAVGGQHIEIVAYLLEQGADPDTPFHLNGYNHLDHGAPLEIAARNEHVGLVKLLLEHGAKPNTSRHACNNAVHYAYASGNKKIIELLIDKGGRRY